MNSTTAPVAAPKPASKLTSFDSFLIAAVVAVPALIGAGAAGFLG